MTVVVEDDLRLAKTPRREAREGYARFLLHRAGVDEENAEEFLHTEQAILYGQSPYSLIYTGRYETAIEAVEAFTEDLTIKDL